MSSHPRIDPERYRTVMGRFVTGVTVVTTLDRVPGGNGGNGGNGGERVEALGRPFGTTVNSFTSVSLEPPLVLIAIGRERSIHPVLARTGRFAVSILAEEAQGLSDCFAGAPSAIPRSAFCGAAWRPSATGMPFLEDALAWVDCELDRVIEAGDHTIYLGRVVGLEASDRQAWPLLYFRRQYLRIEHAESIALLGKPDAT